MYVGCHTGAALSPNRLHFARLFGSRLLYKPVVRNHGCLVAFTMLLAACVRGEVTTDGGVYGFGQPTLLLTVNGVRFGPSAPDRGAFADLVTMRDGSGRITDSQFRAGASSQASGAACNIAVNRFGLGATPIVALVPYQLMSPGPSGTADGTVAPIIGESVSIPQGVWQCTGSTCDGVILSLSFASADHVEGILSGTLVHAGGMGAANVTCSFYLPTRSYVP